MRGAASLAFALRSGSETDGWSDINHHTSEIPTSELTAAVDDGIQAGELALALPMSPVRSTRMHGDSRQVPQTSKTCGASDATGPRHRPTKPVEAAAASLAHTNARQTSLSKPVPSLAAGAAASLAHANQGSSRIARLPLRNSILSEGHNAALAAARKPTAADSTQAETGRGAGQWSLTGAQSALGTKQRTSSKAPSRLAHVDAPRRRRSVPRSALRLESRMALAESAAQGPGTNGGDGRAVIERRRSDVLRAATASFARTSQSRERSEAASGQPSTVQKPKYPHLEEAARRMAEDRLAKIGYLPEYWTPQIPQRSRSLSASASETRAEEINAEVGKLHQTISAADQKKEGHDTLLLMTIARRNVEDRMLQQDRQIADQRGHVRREEWDGVATEVAQRRSDIRLQNFGRINLGCGAYISQGEIDAIAERNVRPVIDDISERARLESRINEEQHEGERERRVKTEQDKRAAAFQKAAHKGAGEEPKKAEARHKSQRWKSRRKRREGDAVDDDTKPMLVARGPQIPLQEASSRAPTPSVGSLQSYSQTAGTTLSQHCPQHDSSREVPVGGEPSAPNNESKQAPENVPIESPRVKHTRSFSAMGLLRGDRLRRLSEQTSRVDESSADRRDGARSNLTGLFNSTGIARRRSTHLAELEPNSRHSLLSRIYHGFGKRQNDSYIPYRSLGSEAPTAASPQRLEHVSHPLAQSGPIPIPRFRRNESPTPTFTNTDPFAYRYGGTTPSKGKGLMRIFKRSEIDRPTPTSPTATASPKTFESGLGSGFRAGVEARTADEEERLKRVSVINNGMHGSRFIEDL